MAQKDGTWSLAKRGNSQAAIRMMVNNDTLSEIQSEPRLSTKRITHTKIVQSRKSDYSPFLEDKTRKSRQGNGRKSTSAGRRSTRKSQSRMSRSPSQSQSQLNVLSRRSQMPKVDTNRISYSKPHHLYYSHHHQAKYQGHGHHHHHHNEPEPSQELLYLIPRAVIIQYGPYTFHGVTDFRVERLQGLQNVLEKMGATVKLVPNTDYRNRVMVWYMDSVIFCTKVTDLVHGGDGELDGLCIHAAYAFDYACRKSIHGLRNRVQLEHETFDSQMSVQAEMNASEEQKGEDSSDTEETEDTEERKKKSQEGKGKKKSKEGEDKRNSKEDNKRKSKKTEDKRNSKGEDKRNSKEENKRNSKEEDKRKSRKTADKRNSSESDKRNSKGESKKKSSKEAGKGAGDEQ